MRAVGGRNETSRRLANVNFVNDGQGWSDLRQKAADVLHKLYDVNKSFQREATPDDERLFKKLEGLVCEIVNGRDRTNRRR